MTRPVPQIAIDFISKAEADVLTPYLDSAGVPTVGVGHTGPDVVMGQPITQDQSNILLRTDLIKSVDKLYERVVANEIELLTDHEYAAMISFVFNVGAGDWTIFRDLSTGALDAIPGQLQRFIYAGGRRLQGLVNRRAAEVALWNTPDVQAALAVIRATPASYSQGPIADNTAMASINEQYPSSGFTRTQATPPAPIIKPLAGPSLVTKIVGGVSAAGAGATQLHGLVLPHVAESHIFAQVAVGLTGVIIVASAVGLFISHHQSAEAKK